MSSWQASVLLLAAGACHLGFQVTVSTLVYPALAEVPPDRWHSAHHSHSRRIAPLVGALYLALVVASFVAIGHSTDVATIVAVTGSGCTVLVTAGLAAPIHSRLGAKTHVPSSDDHRSLLARLRRVDLLRTALAAATLAGALVAAVS